MIMNDSHDAEYQDHARMWRSFTQLMTATVIISALVLLAMAATLV